MRAEELIEKLEQLAPPQLALSWDNPGLICGRRDREITKVMIALDAAEEVVERAAAEGCELVLTHHPMIFHAVKQINDGTALGKKLLRLIQADICCYAMHTNFDAAPGCMADLVCERMRLTKEEPLEPAEGADGAPQDYGIGFVGTCEEPISCARFSELLREQFGLNGAFYYDAGKSIRRAAVCPGSGKGMLEAALRAGADVLVTGDMGHHDGLDALDVGLSLIDAGHFGLEHIFVEFMQAWLKEHAPELTVLIDETDYRHFA